MNSSLFLLMLVFSAAAPAGAIGAEGDAQFFWEIGNLLLLIAVLVLLTRKPIARYFLSRRQTVEQNIQAAESVLQKAERRLDQWNARAARVEGEVEELRRVAFERATQECEQIASDARATAERNERNARSAVEREVRRARQALHAEAVELAIQLASDRIRQEVTESDRSRIVDEFVAYLEEGSRDRGVN